MPLTLGDTAIRTALHASLNAAWSCTEVYDDPPKLPKSAANLPLGFVQLGDMAPVRNGQGAGVNDVELLHTYTLTGQFAWPSSGTIEAAKVAKVQALLSLLTAAKRYALWSRDVTAIRFDTGKAESNEPYFEVEIDFAVRVITDA